MMATLGTAVEEGVKTLPDIIKAAAESTLGILALMIVCLCLLGFLLFRGADVKVKLTIFLCLFGGVVAFGVSVVQEANKPTVTASSPSTSTPAPTSISPFQTSTQSPSPPTTPLTQQEIQSHWEPIIYYVLNSKLVESYVPDNLHPTDLVEAIRDNANLQDLIKNFEGKVTDNAISGRWFTSIDNTLNKIQQDLNSVDRGVAQSPELLRLYPAQRNQLQTAEYARTQLLGLITQVSLQLGMSDPGFPNSAPKMVSSVSPTPTPTPDSTEAPSVTHPDYHFTPTPQRASPVRTMSPAARSQVVKVIVAAQKVIADWYPEEGRFFGGTDQDCVAVLNRLNGVDKAERTDTMERIKITINLIRTCRATLNGAGVTDQKDWQDRSEKRIEELDAYVNELAREFEVKAE